MIYGVGTKMSGVFDYGKGPLQYFDCRQRLRHISARDFSRYDAAKARLLDCGTATARQEAEKAAPVGLYYKNAAYKAHEYR